MGKVLASAQKISFLSNPAVDKLGEVRRLFSCAHAGAGRAKHHSIRQWAKEVSKK